MKKMWLRRLKSGLAVLLLCACVGCSGGTGAEGTETGTDTGTETVSVPYVPSQEELSAREQTAKDLMDAVVRAGFHFGMTEADLAEVTRTVRTDGKTLEEWGPVIRSEGIRGTCDSTGTWSDLTEYCARRLDSNVLYTYSLYVTTPSCDIPLPEGIFIGMDFSAALNVFGCYAEYEAFQFDTRDHYTFSVCSAGEVSCNIQPRTIHGGISNTSIPTADASVSVSAQRGNTTLQGKLLFLKGKLHKICYSLSEQRSSGLIATRKNVVVNIYGKVLKEDGYSVSLDRIELDKQGCTLTVTPTRREDDRSEEARDIVFHLNLFYSADVVDTWDFPFRLENEPRQQSAFIALGDSRDPFYKFGKRYGFKVNGLGIYVSIDCGAYFPGSDNV